MSGNTGKRVAWGIGVAITAILLVVGALWHKSTRPKPAAKVQLAVVGVGLYLGRNQETRQFEVKRVFPNSPAEKAGVVPGLVLNKVGNVLAQTKNIKDLSKLLMGPVGSKVTVEMMDTNNGQTTQLELVREQFLNRSAQPQ
jgi:C-terminal processing protease CtpA/Prc